ncbi:uncharacterized protein SEPMUDRAFT_115102 [Sphaerulina musiva SO2202]|uniref:Uncharacterized protein n=1 Tax=Sphaerulina musiva (strain SO2202) TaxID=692275 RepID=M3C722_SPHMS|nr:uncharacterized protein SEPMUDRAFT_115102 [Sphaerulina musiva SO2202]EMF16046.1 hypothetical protein SEPMUDRAFT_115102 [Sphaerulina musiva SO2202]
MTPSLPGPNGLVFKFYSYWYYDQEGYYVGDPVATKPQAIAKFPGHFKKMEVSFGAKTILVRCDMEATIGKDAGKAITRQGINTLPTATGTPAQNRAMNMDLYLLMIFYVDDIRLIYERDREDQAILFNQYLLSNFEVT